MLGFHALYQRIFCDLADALWSKSVHFPRSVGLEEVSEPIVKT